jgi:hypothetical protein
MGAMPKLRSPLLGHARAQGLRPEVFAEATFRRYPRLIFFAQECIWVLRADTSCGPRP